MPLERVGVGGEWEGDGVGDAGVVLVEMGTGGLLVVDVGVDDGGLGGLAQRRTGHVRGRLWRDGSGESVLMKSGVRLMAKESRGGDRGDGSRVVWLALCVDARKERMWEREIGGGNRGHGLGD